MHFEVLQLAQPFDSQAAPDCALRSRRLGCGRLGDSTIAGAKAGRRAARAKNRPFWPVGDKTGDSSHKPDRKADITRDSSAFSREAGPKTASQPPQPADNRTFWPRPDKTCDYPQPLRPEAAFPRRMKAHDRVTARRRAFILRRLHSRSPKCKKGRRPGMRAAAWGREGGGPGWPPLQGKGPAPGAPPRTGTGPGREGRPAPRDLRGAGRPAPRAARASRRPSWSPAARPAAPEGAARSRRSARRCRSRR